MSRILAADAGQIAGKLGDFIPAARPFGGQDDGTSMDSIFGSIDVPPGSQDSDGPAGRMAGTDNDQQTLGKSRMGLSGSIDVVDSRDPADSRFDRVDNVIDELFSDNDDSDNDVKNIEDFDILTDF